MKLIKKKKTKQECIQKTDIEKVKTQFMDALVEDSDMSSVSEEEHSDEHCSDKNELIDVDNDDIALSSHDAALKEFLNVKKGEVCAMSDSEDEQTVKKKQDPDEKVERTLFVGNLSPKVSKKILIQLFTGKKYGGPGCVEAIRIRGAATKNGTGGANAKRRSVIQGDLAEWNKSLCAFVVLNHKSKIAPCLLLNGKEVDGRVLRVDQARKVGQGSKIDYSDQHCVFVGNLPYDVTEDMVREVVSTHGEVLNVRLVRDHQTGIGKGFGYVQLSSVESIKKLCGQKSDLMIGERNIRIEKWAPSKTQKELRKTDEGKKKVREKKKMDKKNLKKENQKHKKVVVVPTNLKKQNIKQFISNKHEKSKVKRLKRKQLNKKNNNK